MKVFRSITEVKQHYFPDAYKKEQWEKMTPEEKGRQLGIETINKIKRGI